MRHSYARLNGEDVISDPKTRRSKRFITVPDFLLEIIREYAAKLYEYQPEERLFECTKYWLKEQLERCCQRTGVKVIRVHDIRHSHASLLINMGTDALLVQQRLGHEKFRQRSAPTPTCTRIEQTTSRTAWKLWPPRRKRNRDTGLILPRVLLFCYFGHKKAPPSSENS